MAILKALRDGPLTGRRIADRLDGYRCPDRAYKYAYQALHKMKKEGIVANDKGVWRVV